MSFDIFSLNDSNHEEEKEEDVSSTEIATTTTTLKGPIKEVVVSADDTAENVADLYIDTD